MTRLREKYKAIKNMRKIKKKNNCKETAENKVTDKKSKIKLSEEDNA